MAITKDEIIGKYCVVKIVALDEDIVSPNITMPIWSSLVPVDLRTSPSASAEPINKVKLIPKTNATKGEPIIKAIKAKIVPSNNFIFLNAVLVMLGHCLYETL